MADLGIGEAFRDPRSAWMCAQNTSRSARD